MIPREEVRKDLEAVARGPAERPTASPALIDALKDHYGLPSAGDVHGRPRDSVPLMSCKSRELLFHGCGRMDWIAGMIPALTLRNERVTSLPARTAERAIDPLTCDRGYPLPGGRARFKRQASGCLNPIRIAADGTLRTGSGTWRPRD